MSSRSITLVPFVLALLPVPMLAQAPETDTVKDRIEIQEKLLYAYAYAVDSNDCESFANLFATDAVLDLGGIAKASGRDAICRRASHERTVQEILRPVTT